VSAIIATVVLASNNKAIRLGGLAIDILRIIVAGVAMAIAVRFGSDMFISSDSSLTISVAGLAALTRVLVGITIGGVTYIAALALLGEPHLRNYWLTRTTKSSR
jgi:hypothetical protein